MRKNFLLILLILSSLIMLYSIDNNYRNRIIIRFNTDDNGMMTIRKQSEVIGIMSDLCKAQTHNNEDEVFQLPKTDFWIESRDVRINYTIWKLPTKLVIFNENSRQYFKLYFNESKYLYNLLK